MSGTGSSDSLDDRLGLALRMKPMKSFWSRKPYLSQSNDIVTDPARKVAVSVDKAASSFFKALLRGGTAFQLKASMHSVDEQSLQS